MGILIAAGDLGVCLAAGRKVAVLLTHDERLGAAASALELAVESPAA